MKNQRAWAFKTINKKELRYRGNDGYDDNPFKSYSYDNFVANPYLKIKSFEYTEIEEKIHFAFVPMLNTYNELTVIDSQLSEKDNLIFSIIDYGEMINGYTIIQTLNEAEIELNGELINRNMNYLLRSFLGYQYIILEK